MACQNARFLCGRGSDVYNNGHIVSGGLFNSLCYLHSLLGAQQKAFSGGAAGIYSVYPQLFVFCNKGFYRICVYVVVFVVYCV